METALHTAYAILTGKEMKDPDITPVRWYEKDITKAVIPISLKDYGGKIIEIKVAVVNGASRNINNIVKKIDRW